MEDYFSETLCCLITPNSLYSPTPRKVLGNFLKIIFYDQSLPTLKSVFNKLSKIFPAVTVGYIGFFPPQLLYLRVLGFKENKQGKDRKIGIIQISSNT